MSVWNGIYEEGFDPMAPDDTRGEPCDVCGVWPCQHTDPDTWEWGDDGQPVETNDGGLA